MTYAIQPLKRLALISFFAILSASSLQAQVNDSIKAGNNYLDSLYIDEIERRSESVKVLHAEPLYIDLIRDLGARKGEKEWNVGLGLTDNQSFDEYLALVEYEWAIIDRLGLEVELPFSFYYPTENGSAVDAPDSRLNSLKMAAQYSFFVSDKWSTSMAVGYIQEFELTGFRNYGNESLFIGNVYNPFFIAAKRWGQNFHSLIYAGPQVFHHFADQSTNVNWQINTSFHYMIDGTRNFLGIEFNKDVSQGVFDMVIRPQMRVGVADDLMIGIVTGIPIGKANERFSSFIRLIYEPGHRHTHRLPHFQHASRFFR